MTDSISPYALLQASRPKQPPTVVTTYDLYSAVHAGAPAAQGSTPLAPTGNVPPAQPSINKAPSASRNPPRTHYIQDIHTKHNKAASRPIAPMYHR